MFYFELQTTDPHSKARAGFFQTTHGVVETPVFMPVGTFASVKTVSTNELKNLGAQIILGNTYHLFMRPGAKVFEKFGGIHSFIGWKKPVLTDSGGFQLFSLSHQREITEEGAIFRSYTDGKFHLLSPEVSIQMQTAIGSDIMMVLDQCVSSKADYSETKRAMELTHRWALRSLNARKNTTQALFCIVQGGINFELRKMSADFLTQQPFDGFAVGGLAVGETKEQRESTTDFVTEFLPKNKPRYLMGVGTPIDLLEAVRRGIDMFDCVLPTKFAQQGIAFTWNGKVNTSRTVYRFSDSFLDPNCTCDTCTHYSLGYLHHLIKCQEPLGWRALAYHNLWHYIELMRKARGAILDQKFYDFYRSTIPLLSQVDTLSRWSLPDKKDTPYSSY